MKYRLLVLKRGLEDLLMFPLILLGRLIAARRPLQKEYRVFYFFPFYHTGGAEKIHALVVQTTASPDCIVYFTRKSHNETFLSAFQKAGCAIRDISRYTDNKWLYPVNIIFRGIISGYINRQKGKTVVFNGQCNFGYKLSPWINQEIKQIELIHSLNTFSYIRLPFLPFISQTVMISQVKIREHIELYKRFGVPGNLAERIRYIPNASDFDTISVDEKDLSSVRVFYSGRATPEKRPHLVTAIAKRVQEQDPSISFILAGDDFKALRSAETAFIDFAGNIKEKEKLHGLYRRSNVLLITSSTEGFPLAVIEGMAYGAAILATPVGDVPVHVQPGMNGFLFSTVTDEETIIQEATRWILELQKNKDLLRTISANNIAYAQANFTLRQFGEAYKKLIDA
ncbi:glycosyltransferase family 4 protein [Flavisolibacter nicotianae]|uniref:glycosyltransferase family 4 protein n=1 Tax=Flavisolibacter nicotianae TaxID=2364882 RepID=UPI0013C3F99B|nr:glycosyltransferase family 4 protein [Flavisolibacter nicotianae]